MTPANLPGKPSAFPDETTDNGACRYFFPVAAIEKGEVASPAHAALLQKAMDLVSSHTPEQLEKLLALAKEQSPLRNEALLVNRDELNFFTMNLKELCLERGRITVKLRNGQTADVKFRYMVPGAYDYDMFYSPRPGGDLFWALSGISYRSRDLDIVGMERP